MASQVKAMPRATYPPSYIALIAAKQEKMVYMTTLERRKMNQALYYNEVTSKVEFRDIQGPRLGNERWLFQILYDPSKDAFVFQSYFAVRNRLQLSTIQYSGSEYGGTGPRQPGDKDQLFSIIDEFEKQPGYASIAQLSEARGDRYLMSDVAKGNPILAIYNGNGPSSWKAKSPEAALWIFTFDP